MGEKRGRVRSVRKVLFGCETVYQVFNSVILAQTEFSGDSCDAVLSNETPWRDGFVQSVRASGVFRNVETFDVKSRNERFGALSRREQRRVYGNPSEYFAEAPLTEERHDILCFPIDHLHWVLHYHYCARRGDRPEVHLYDEGVRSYTMPIELAESQPYAEGVYPDDSFFRAIAVLHLHRPALYSNAIHPFCIKAIPRLDGNDGLRAAIFSIFGREEPPAERYIYLEDFFFADRCVSNDMTLFLQFAEIVGRENIRVKRHPRDDVSRYAPLGFKEYPVVTVPWEVQLLGGDYSEKVLVSVSSTALLTPVMIFDAPGHVVSLEKMFRGNNPTHSDAAFQVFMDKFRALANSGSVRFHTPESFGELRDVLLYLNVVHS